MLENELFAFLEGTTDAAFSVSEQGKILSWNGAAETILRVFLFGGTGQELFPDTARAGGPWDGSVSSGVQHSGMYCGQTEIPNFRYGGQPAFRGAVIGQLVYSGVAKPEESTPSGDSSGT